MLRLDTTTRKLQALLGGAVTANQLPVIVSYSDKTTTAYNGGSQLSTTNGATPVDICSAPAASTVRDIDTIVIRNADTAAATITVRYNDNGTTYDLVKTTLAVGDALFYTHGSGWKSVDADGNDKTNASGGGGISDGDKGDVTVSSSGTVWTIDNDAISNAKLANMATATIKGRTTAGTGDPEDLTATQATALLNAMVGDSGSGGTKGLVPAPAAGDAAAGKFLKADGTWAAPSGSGDAIQADIQTQDYTRFTSGGTADAITGTLSPAVANYAAGLRVTTTPGGANTVTGPTLNLNGLGAKTIKKRDSGGTKVALAGGDYNASGPFDFEYDGTDFILLNPIPATGVRLGTSVASTSGTSIDFTALPPQTKKISIEFSGVSTNGSSVPIVQIGDSDGVETSGYYGAVNNFNGAGVSNLSSYFQLVTSHAAAQVIHGIMHLVLLDPATNLWAASSVIGRSDTTGLYQMAGSKALTGVLDRVRITTAGGTDSFDAGKINISYE